MLTFRTIDRHNFRDILALSVGEDQREFVATNAYSLAQAKAQPECVPLALYEGDTPVDSACTVWTSMTENTGFTG